MRAMVEHTQMVGAIHGRLLTAWATAGILGPVVVNYMRDYQLGLGIPREQVYNQTMFILVGMLVVGLIEGLAEATALIVKVFSGSLSDYLGTRKGLAVLGYALGAMSKPLFALSSGAGLVITARLIDRVGKGIRGAPRDALVADIAPPEVRGAAFGLRQS